jgi:phosphoadenosine phosphosulfate reductase
MLLTSNNEDLNKKVERSIRLLKSIGDKEVELAYSGGKDSDVILQLAKLSGITYRAIYKNTTIDPIGTIKHCKSKGVEIVNPKYTFYELIEQHGFPTRRARFCCGYLKEYKILDNCIQGIRRCESVKRNKRYKEPIMCRVYGSKSNHVNVILPILEWTDKDVSDFILQQNITCHSLYYKDGKFDVTKRLGCMGCPLKSDKGLADFKQNPKLVKEWIKHGQVWWNKPREKPSGSQLKFNNIYELFAQNIFFDSYNDFATARDGFFGKVDFKERLESFFKIELP